MGTTQLEALVAGALAVAISVVVGTLVARADECLPAKPGNQRGQYYSWRVIDGRACWYAGRPGRSKSQLHWAIRTRHPVSDAPDVNPVEVVRESAVSQRSDLDGTFLYQWCDIMSDLATPWWRDRSEVKTWTGVLSGGQ
jgi:hypothetical protein